MGACRFFLLCFSLVTVVSAQQTTSGLLKLEGITVNSITGKPLPRVLVQFANRAVLTGPQGEFSFDQVHPGPVQLMVSKPGYFGPNARMRGVSGTINAEVSADSDKLVVKMSPEAVIFGQVTGRDEEPLEGVLVQALSLNFYNGPRQLVPMNSTTSTDEDGNYRLAGLPAGRYYIQVRPINLNRRNLVAPIVKNNEIYPPAIYYPGTPDVSAATMIQMAPGQTTEAAFSLAPVPAFRITGTLVKSGEWKQVDVPALLDGMGQVIVQPEHFDSASGDFEFRSVPAGVYKVRLGGQDAQGQYMYSDHPLTVSQAIGNLKLTLQPGLELPVVIRTELSTPRQPRSCSVTHNGDVHNSDCSDYPAAFVELAELDSVGKRYATNFEPLKDPFTAYLHGVSAGRYLVRARPTFGGYVESLSCGSADLLREPLVVPEDGSLPPIQVVVRDDTASLKVLVHSDQSLRNVVIVAVPEGAFLPEPRVIGGGPGTEFSYGALAPGAYKVYAFDSRDDVEWSNLESLEKFASSAGTVSVAANDKATIVVDLIHTGD